jgi:pimeloyl-ACP methyl ester carboxylesterase
MFPVVSGLEQEYRVIAIGYPAAATNTEEATEGIKAILDEYRVRHACLLGHSFGGMLARAFSLEYPERVDSLIIANSAAYSPGRRLFFKAVLPVMARLPHAILVGAIRSGFSRLLKNHSDREFWLGYVGQSEMARPDSPGIRNQLLCMADLLRNRSIARANPGGWNGRILILESAKETGFTARERHDFRLLYPGASVHVFAHAGHLSFITHTQEFISVAADFIAARKTPPSPKPD